MYCDLGVKKMVIIFVQGVVDIQFICLYDYVEFEDGDVYQMVESIVFFEVYCYVFEGFKEIIFVDLFLQVIDGIFFLFYIYFFV